jgi:hypothetical protein
MRLENEDPRSELAQEGKGDKSKGSDAPLPGGPGASKDHSDARTKRLRQQMRQDLDAYNMRSLQTESEALDLRTEAPLHRSAVSVH